MSEFGIDWAWGSISPGSLHSIGARFAARYLSHDGSKNLSPGEARRLSAGGINIVVVWESTANRSAEGYTAGRQDALDAEAQAHACGMPARRPIYFAVDFDAAPGQVDEYFRGAASVLGARRVGVYGGYRTVNHLFNNRLVGFAWQTYAWSGGAWDPRAHIHQYSNDHTVAGVGVDYDRAVRRDYGAWRVGQKAAPVKPPRYPGHRIKPGDKGPNVALIQERLGLNADGIFGPKTKEAVLAFKRQHKLLWAKDAVVGLVTWHLLFR